MVTWWRDSEVELCTVKSKLKEKKPQKSWWSLSALKCCPQTCGWRCLASTLGCTVVQLDNSDEGFQRNKWNAPVQQWYRACPAYVCLTACKCVKKHVQLHCKYCVCVDSWVCVLYCCTLHGWKITNTSEIQLVIFLTPLIQAVTPHIHKRSAWYTNTRGHTNSPIFKDIQKGVVVSMCWDQTAWLQELSC